MYGPNVGARKLIVVGQVLIKQAELGEEVSLLGAAQV